MRSRRWRPLTIGHENCLSVHSEMPRACWLRSRIPAKGFTPNKRANCSNRSLRPSRRASAWGFLSAARSWRPIEVHCGLRRVPAERFFSSLCPKQPMNEAASIVYVIDDDTSVREALRRLIRSVGLAVEVFGSTADFLQRERRNVASCLVLDVRLPGKSGLDFQRELGTRGNNIPIIFITAHGDIPMSVQAMKAGAIEFLTKPFRDQDLLDAVNVGLSRDRERREDQLAVSALRARFNVLTVRERAILTQVVAGRLNKQIAGDLGITETTVKVHRSNAMRKIKASSLAELCRMVEKLKLPPDSSEPA